MSHWKRLRAHFEASSRTEIVSRVLQTQHGDELNALQGQRDQLLYEIAQRERAEAQLKEVVAQLEVEVKRRAEVMTSAMAASTFHSSEAKRIAANREELAAMVSKCRIIFHSGRYGGPWDKDYISDSMEEFGYSSEEWTSGKINIFYVSLPNDMTNSITAFDKAKEGVRKIVLPHWFYSRERRPYLLMDFLVLEDPDEVGAGNYYAASLDITEWMEPMLELYKSGLFEEYMERKKAAEEQA